MHQNSLTTGLPALDDALESSLDPGHVILIAGVTGSGKTILATQLAARMARDGNSVIFVTTEAVHWELEARMISAQCTCPYDKLTSPPKYLGPVLNPRVYGKVVAVKELQFKFSVKNKLYFYTGLIGTRQEEAGVEWQKDPATQLNILREDCIENQGSSPKVLVFDYLKPIPPVKIDPFHCQEVVYKIADALREFARSENALVIVFAQATPNAIGKKEITAESIDEFKKLASRCDAFIGITQLHHEDDSEEQQAVYSEEQFFVVTLPGKPNPVFVPVRQEFLYQRFAEREGPHQDDTNLQPLPKLTRTKAQLCAECPDENDDHLRLEAQRIEVESEFPGYVLANRTRLRRARECPAPYAINLYAFLLLVSGPMKTARSGESWYSRAKLTELLGLSSKQLRTATSDLDYFELISARNQGRSSIRYLVSHWEQDQDPKVGGYWKLFRNLRDTSRSEILSDQKIFRFWLWLLSNTRSIADDSGVIAVGDVLLKRRAISEELKLSAPEIDRAIDVLEARGSIIFSNGTQDKLSVVNWHIYQHAVCAPKRDRNPKTDRG